MEPDDPAASEINVDALRRAGDLLDINSAKYTAAAAMTHAQCARLSSAAHADRVWAQHRNHPKDHPLIFWPDGHTTVM